VQTNMEVIERAIQDANESLSVHRRTAIEDLDPLSRLVAAEEARKIQDEILPAYRDELAKEREAEQAAAIDRWATLVATEMPHRAAELVEAVATVKAALVDLEVAANAYNATVRNYAREAQGHIGQGAHPRVDVSRVGVRVDRKALKEETHSVFAEVAVAVASLADSIGASGYGDALRNTTRVGPATLRTDWQQKDTPNTPKEKN
jgi:hypothetical protein